ncbi:uncharacterized protein KD926_010225, partial [Aspergillus affinis]|uniref:uncharacterized protein n=1 Tax=Aspergillus affinis TaxID=1070780 RepID=UPI0022FDE26D
MSVPTSSTLQPAEIGFSRSNWTQYLAYRPLYPPSFYERIYTYHAAKPLASWTHVHDNGTDCGIVASSLSSRFAHVTASDPNEKYIDIARKMLLEGHQGKSVSEMEKRFTFLQEPGEKSSLGSKTVDLVSFCECVHWMDTRTFISEVAGELKVGGTESGRRSKRSGCELFGRKDRQEAPRNGTELYGLRGELEGARMALDRAKPTPITVFSDSQAAIQAVRNPGRPSGQYALQAIYGRIRALRNEGLKDAELRWIPAHIGVEGSEKADKAAKEAAIRGVDISS